MGGFNAAGASLNNVFVFDGSKWASGPSLPLPLDHASAATLGDRVYIAGGHNNGADSARLFRLDGNRWTRLASMHFARGGHALIAANGRLYAIGGNTAQGNVAAAEVYDPNSPDSERWLMWIEPGTMSNPPPSGHGVPYFLSASGFTDAEFWRVANSLR